MLSIINTAKLYGDNHTGKQTETEKLAAGFELFTGALLTAQGSLELMKPSGASGSSKAASVADDAVSAGKVTQNAVGAAESGTNLVYQGFDKAGVVRYVGITEREATVRFGEHLSSGTAKSLLRYEVVPSATNLSRAGARVGEQTLINQYGLQKNGGLLLNKINSIAPKNWWQYGINP